MLSEEEKSRIVERIEFETQVRQQLAPPKEPDKSRWWESRLALLLIGSLITGLLVPAFQYTQETIKWKRQNRFENVQYRLNAMRECLREFVALSAFPSEAYERARPLLDRAAVSEAELAKFAADFLELQNRRFRQNAKVAAMLVYFPARAELVERFNRRYLTAVSGYFRRIEDTAKNRRPGNATEVELDGSLRALDGEYLGIVQLMRQQIGSLEDESERFM